MVSRAPPTACGGWVVRKLNATWLFECLSDEMNGIGCETIHVFGVLVFDIRLKRFVGRQWLAATLPTPSRTILKVELRHRPRCSCMLHVFDEIQTLHSLKTYLILNRNMVVPLTETSQVGECRRGWPEPGIARERQRYRMCLPSQRTVGSCRKVYCYQFQ